jgi:hypothetical protein
MLVCPDDFCDLIRDTLDTHLWKFVVCCDFGRSNHVPFFPFELLLDTAIEEECDMRILFSLYKCVEIC